MWTELSWIRTSRSCTFCIPHLFPSLPSHLCKVVNLLSAILRSQNKASMVARSRLICCGQNSCLTNAGITARSTIASRVAICHLQRQLITLRRIASTRRRKPSSYTWPPSILRLDHHLRCLHVRDPLRAHCLPLRLPWFRLMQPGEHR